MPELKHLNLRRCSSTTSKTIINLAPRLEKLEIISYNIKINNTLINSIQHLREFNAEDIIYDVYDTVEITQTPLEIFRAENLYFFCPRTVHGRKFAPDSDYCKYEYFDSLCGVIIPQMFHLKVLHLGNNNLKNLSRNAFKNIAPNCAVFLNNNYLNRGGTLNLNSLSLLDLSGNLISNLDNFNINGHIGILNLSFNQIKKWNSNDIFNSDSRNIKHVNISNNKIEALDNEMLKSLASLESVDIGGNPFDCSNCLLYGLQQWLKSNTKTHVKNLGKHFTTLKCTIPFDLKDTLLINAPFNEFCYSYEPLYVGIFIPLLTLTIVFGSLSFIYRLQLEYMIHMIRFRKRAMDGRQKRKKLLYDAFVSYSSCDRTWVQDVLMQTLENDENKFALCLHERDFRLGRYIMDNVAECMDSSRNVILVLSPNFVSSKCPRAGEDMDNFWICIKQALGQPLGIPNKDDCQENDAEQQAEESYEMQEMLSV
ncbi:hypothetical protein B566_EDAN017056 [Ephemera danica]|nr:hypothetical protein B566_EDAN017056 [Ephemera danica]